MMTVLCVVSIYIFLVFTVFSVLFLVRNGNDFDCDFSFRLKEFF
jgi:hypothetical protein